MWESHLSEYLNGNIHFGYVSHVLLILGGQREAFYHSRVFISVGMCRCSATLSQHQKVWANFAPLEFLSLLKQIQ